MLTRQEAHQILTETIEYYRTNPRGYSAKGASCKYFIPETGAVCAIGRLAKTQEERLELHKHEGQSVRLTHLQILGRDEADLEFYKKLQSLHDNAFNWTGFHETDNPAGDLTMSGKIYVNELKEFIDEQYKDVLPIGNKPLEMTEINKSLNQQIC